VSCMHALHTRRDKKGLKRRGGQGYYLFFSGPGWFREEQEEEQEKEQARVSISWQEHLAFFPFKTKKQAKYIANTIRSFIFLPPSSLLPPPPFLPL